MARAVAARALRLFGLLVGTVVLFALLLTVVFALPSDPVARNVRASVPVLAGEGVYPRLLFDSAAYQLDNTTDSLMLDIALGQPGAGPFQSALAMYYGVHVAEDGDFDPIEVLRISSTGQRAHTEPYARYWHGYQVVLRPALHFFALEDLRRINAFVLGALVSALLAFTWKRVGVEASIAAASALLLSGFAIAPLSLQYSGMTYVAILGMLATILLGERVTTSKGDLELFLVLGATTAFVDLLTAPLLTLGLPLGVALAMRVRTVPDDGAKQDLVFAGRAAVAWGAGYVGSWAAKWVLGAAFVGSEVTDGAAEQARLWIGGPAAPAVTLDALKVNVMNMVPWVRFDPALSGVARYLSAGLVPGVVFAVALILLFRHHRSVDAVKRAAVMLVLVPMPYAWLAILGPHSKLHYAYTYRVQAVAVFAVVCFFAASIDWGHLRRRSAAGSASVAGDR